MGLKILDKYIAKNFLISYLIAFGVLVGLRVIIDLFVNIDEFTEHSGLVFLEVLQNIVIYYGLNSSLYFRDFAGMITVMAAAFSIGKMVRNNELVAVLSSGVSLKRVICPIIVLALLLTGLLIIDQEFIIAPLSDKLVRDQDTLPGEETYDVDFLLDSSGSLISSQKFDVAEQSLYYPTIILRKRIKESMIWNVTGKISATKAVYGQDGKWTLVDGQYSSKEGLTKPVEYYQTDLTPKDIPVRSKAQYNTLLSFSQLTMLANMGGQIRDMAQLLSQKHFRVTEPIINFITLLLVLPVLVRRDSRHMRSAIGLSFLLSGACYITAFICKMLASEMIFGRVVPHFWAWLPVFIFLPIAIIEIDSMET